MGKTNKKHRKQLHTKETWYANNAGFTLVELMIAVTIIGIVVAVAAPQMGLLTTRMTHEQNFNKFRAAWGNCRAEALNSTYSVTMPTSMAVFPNGYACIIWDDKSPIDSKLGSGGGVGAETLSTGSMNGEVIKVLFQERFDETENLDSTAAETRINFTHASSKVHAFGSSIGGYLFLIAPGGYVQTPTRELFIGGGATQPTAAFVMEQDNGPPSVLKIMVSGQIDGI